MIGRHLIECWLVIGVGWLVWSYQVMPSPPKLEQNTRMRGLHDEGLSLRQISMQLWREGFTNRDGEPISAQRISRKLKQLEQE